MFQCAKIGYFLIVSAIFSWRAIASQYYILMSGFAGHDYKCWLVIASHETIASGSEPAINVSGEAGHDHKCWLAIARHENIANGSESAINVSGEAGHDHKCWLAIARQENITKIMNLNEYIFPNR